MTLLLLVVDSAIVEGRLKLTRLVVTASKRWFLARMCRTTSTTIVLIPIAL